MISPKTVRKILLYACLAYVLFIALSFAFSMPLPHFREVGAQRGDFCYWTDAMVSFVECGSNVEARQWWDFFYNFWMKFIYYPMFTLAALMEGFASKLILLTVLLYTPIALLLYLIFKHFKTRKAAPKTSS